MNRRNFTKLALTSTVALAIFPKESLAQTDEEIVKNWKRFASLTFLYRNSSMDITMNAGWSEAKYVLEVLDKTYGDVYLLKSPEIVMYGKSKFIRLTYAVQV